MTSSHGKVEQLLSFSDKNDVVTTTDVLRRMLQHQDAKNRKIVAFSIIGEHRKGKSFFLDNALKFMYANYKSINYPNNPLTSPSDWMGPIDMPLSGFSWRAGTTRDTNGIIVWNDVFLHEVPSTGEKLAIILMDTQGLFDNRTSDIDNSRIFALSTLISSMQVLNLNGVVQENQLQYLQFATEFAQFTASDNLGGGGQPFQNLLFLMRDWQNVEEYPYGKVGGEAYLNSFLQITGNQKEELQTLRRFIRSSFEKLSCALLPHPGKIVTGAKKSSKGTSYNGNWGEMDEDFKQALEELIVDLLSPHRLVVKKINGKSLSSAEYLEYVDQFFKLFKSKTLPAPKSIYESTVEKQMLLVVDNCFDCYKEYIQKNIDLLRTVEQIPIFHKAATDAALIVFKDARKMGNRKHHEAFEAKLIGRIKDLYDQWKSQSKASIKRLEEEQEKTKAALEEKERLYREQVESEKAAAQQLLELERQLHEQKITEEQYKKEKEIAEMRAEAEAKRLEDYERQKREDDERRKELQEKLKRMNDHMLMSMRDPFCTIL